MWGWSIGFVLLSFVFLLVQLPASWVIRQLPPLPIAVEFAQTTGTVWQGETLLQTPLLSARPANVHWQWQASELLVGRAQWQLEAEVDRALVNVVCTLSRSGWSVNGDVVAAAASPLPQWAQLLPAGGQSNQRVIRYQMGW